MSSNNPTYEALKNPDSLLYIDDNLAQTLAVVTSKEFCKFLEESDTIVDDRFRHCDYSIVGYYHASEINSHIEQGKYDERPQLYLAVFKLSKASKSYKLATGVEQLVKDCASSQDFTEKLSNLLNSPVINLMTKSIAHSTNQNRVNLNETPEG